MGASLSSECTHVGIRCGSNCPTTWSLGISDSALTRTACSARSHVTHNQRLRRRGGLTSATSKPTDPHLPSVSAVVVTSMSGAVRMLAPHSHAIGRTSNSRPHTQKNVGPGSSAIGKWYHESTRKTPRTPTAYRPRSRFTRLCVRGSCPRRRTRGASCRGDVPHLPSSLTW